MRILVAGANGFIGRRLVQVLHRRGDSIVALARNPEKANDALHGHARVVGWNPPEPGAWVSELSQVDAVVNLAGEPLVGRWTDAHKKKIYDSRIDSTRALVDAIATAPTAAVGRAGARPRILVQTSATGYYGETTAPTDETAAPGKDYLAKICVDWEKEASRAEALGTKVVVLRFGVVLGKGGALEKMAIPFKMFVGGPIGSGRQYVPWVALDDAVGMIEMALFNANVTGPINVVGPEPCTNRAFARELGRVLHRPSMVPTPEAAVHMVMGDGAVIVTKGQHVVPKRAIELEYPFLHPSLRGALRAGLGVVD